MTNPTSLDARYGRTPTRSRRTSAIAVITAGAFAVVFAAWLVWGGLLGAPAQLQAVDVGHSIVSDSEVDVRWELTVDPGSDVSCAVQALDSSFGIVGWKVVEVPADDRRTRTLTETVRTVEPPVTGLIYRCWLT